MNNVATSLVRNKILTQLPKKENKIRLQHRNCIYIDKL